jgi:CheY-like chemotaxis protein
MKDNSNKFVYIVNDDDLILLLFKKMLKNIFDIEKCKFFNNPEDALYQIQYDFEVFQQIPRLIILDLYMPQMSGWEFLEKINQKYSNPYIDVKIYTSSIRLEDIEKIELFPNIIKYISKPITVEILEDLKD